MTKKDYLEFHREFCDKMINLTKIKNADYTGDSDDPFCNFRLCESVGVSSVMQGFLTRMLDKIARVNSFAQKGYLSVKEESVQDALLDLANYAILMAGFIKSETEPKPVFTEIIWGDPDFKVPNEKTDKDSDS